MDQIKKVAVIGAGMGGLALGKALLDRNIDVTIYEQASQLTQVGAGIQLTPNAVKVLRGSGSSTGSPSSVFFRKPSRGAIGGAAEASSARRWLVSASGSITRPISISIVPICRRSSTRRCRIGSCSCRLNASMSPMTVGPRLPGLRMVVSSRPT